MNSARAKSTASHTFALRKLKIHKTDLPRWPSPVVAASSALKARLQELGPGLPLVFIKSETTPRHFSPSARRYILDIETTFPLHLDAGFVNVLSQ